MQTVFQENVHAQLTDFTKKTLTYDVFHVIQIVRHVLDLHKHNA